MKVEPWATVGRESSIDAKQSGNRKLNLTAAGAARAGAGPTAATQFSRPSQRAIFQTSGFTAIQAGAAGPAVAAPAPSTKNIGEWGQRAEARARPFATAKTSGISINGATDLNLNIIAYDQMKPGRNRCKQRVVADRNRRALRNRRPHQKGEHCRAVGSAQGVICAGDERRAGQIRDNDRVRQHIIIVEGSRFG